MRIAGYGKIKVKTEKWEEALTRKGRERLL